jgi:hypothetical protein
MTDDLSIESAINNLMGGNIRIPAFQRGFVWDADRVALFMDSLYKGYPFGSLLFWRTKQPLRTERQLGPYHLPPGDPDYPIDYVLDGQQRLTSIFGVFQTALEEQHAEGWLPIYFDFLAEPDAQDTQFFALKDEDVDPLRHFPLKAFFSPHEYRTATRALDEQIALKLDTVQKRFLQVILPVQTFQTDEQARVAIVFERVNRLGIRLDALQLLTAWSWSEEFDLQEQFEALANELMPFGFDSVNEDPNLLLRCCAAVVAGDASPSALVSLNGATVRTRFDEIRNGVRGAIDFLKNVLNVQSLKSLPYSTQLVPLSVFFAIPGGGSVKTSDSQRQELERWFWRSCFSRRYSSAVLRNLKTDIEEMAKLRDKGASSVSAFTCDVSSAFFLGNTLNTGAVNSKTFILLLAQHKPLSFASGAPVALANVLADYNRSEFHHIYPRSFLRTIDIESDSVNLLANFAFISAIDNKIIGGDAPSVYMARMARNRLSKIAESAFLPEETWTDDFLLFLPERAEMLAAAAKKLIE